MSEETSNGREALRGRVALGLGLAGPMWAPGWIVLVHSIWGDDPGYLGEWSAALFAVQGAAMSAFAAWRVQREDSAALRRFADFGAVIAGAMCFFLLGPALTLLLCLAACVGLYYLPE